MVDRLLLVGMMGAGKTTVGKLVAARLGWAYVDSDAQVEAATGRSVAELFAEGGEAAFRAEESRALAEAVSGEASVVISVAGGAVLDPENRALIGHAGTVVWLRAELDTLVRRVGSGVSRPLLGDDPRSALTFLMAKRYPLYQDVADVVIDVDGLRPDEVADSVVAARHVPEGRVR